MTLTSRLRAVLATGLVAFMLAACGSQGGGQSPAGGSEAGGNANTQTGAAGEPAESEAAAGENAVTLKGLSFQPDAIQVAAGTEVTWTNEDAQVRHTITAGTPGERAIPGSGEEDEPPSKAGEFEGMVADAGDTFSFTFAEAGAYAYFCEIHPTMTGEVVVE